MPQRLVNTPRRALTTALVLSALLAGAFALSTYSLYRSHEVSCDGRDQALKAMRDILLDSRASQLQERLNSEQRESISRFYQVELRRIDKARC